MSAILASATDVESARPGPPSRGVALEPRGVTPEQIIVIGMHRSGTSAVAGLLCRAGSWVGADEDLLPGNEGNPRGYFERRSAAASLDQLLAGLGGSWDDPALHHLEAVHLEPLRPQLRQLLTEVSSSAPDGRVPLVKDPRLTLFAGELASLIGSAGRIVLCVRHPVEVARSLHELQHIPIPVGLALWEAYNSIACSGLEGTPVHVFSLDRALGDKAYASAFVASVLGGNSADPLMDLEAGCALEPALRRQRVYEADERRWLSVAQREMWVLLEAASRSPQPTALKHVEISAAARAELLRRRHAQSLETDLASRTAAREHESAAAVAQVEAVRVEAESWRTRFGEAEAVRSYIAGELAAVSAVHAEEAESWRGRFGEAEARRATLEGELAVAKAASVSLKTVLAQTADDLVASQDRIKETVETNGRLTRDLQSAEQEHQELQRQLIQESDDREQLVEMLMQRDAEALVAFEDLRLMAGDVETLSEQLRSVRADRDAAITEWVAVSEERSIDVAASADDAVAVAAVQELLVQVDRYLGFLESVRSVSLMVNGPGSTPDDPSLLRWVEGLARGAREGSQALVVPPPGHDGADPGLEQLRNEARYLASELVAVRDHRDLLVEEINAVCGSESWKIGYALTWPVRKLRRSHPGV